MTGQRWPGIYKRQGIHGGGWRGYWDGRGADPKVSRNFYIAVTQQVLLFGAETWVLTRKMEAALDAFQGRVARRLTGRMPRRGRDGKWL